ncbi:allantoicase [Cephus cinctus]|uniref:Allantoate amidinohydrolase n=1 Tax=Cephus cinctus TaxID=211228 RepID=A0AAJ7BGH4_CEPCN|nr:allantoicase [Cephus cinctus]
MVIGTLNTIPKFVELNELASESNGGKILFATDDWFANAENLLKDHEPVWKEGVFTEYGKWMDGWETRRKRCTGHDWAIIALGRPSVIKGICIDTALFTGNYAPRFSVQAARLSEKDNKKFPARNGVIGAAANKRDMEKMSVLKTENWTTIIDMKVLGAGYEETRRNYFTVSSSEIWTHLRLNIYPDGGIARFHVYGFASPDWHSINHNEEIDLIASENGSICEGYSDAHYGHPRNLIKPGRGVNMGDGWETARRLDRPPIIEVDNAGILRVPGSEWAIFKLGHVGEIHRIEVDTNHFKGNFPDSVKIEGIMTSPGQDIRTANWKVVMTPKKLSAHRVHEYCYDDMIWHGPISHVKVSMAPDGGISRVRVWGYIKQQ